MITHGAGSARRACGTRGAGRTRTGSARDQPGTLVLPAVGDGARSCRARARRGRDPRRTPSRHRSDDQRGGNRPGPDRSHARDQPDCSRCSPARSTRASDAGRRVDRPRVVVRGAAPPCAAERSPDRGLQPVGDLELLPRTGPPSSSSFCCCPGGPGDARTSPLLSALHCSWQGFARGAPSPGRPGAPRRASVAHPSSASRGGSRHRRDPDLRPPAVARRALRRSRPDRSGTRQRCARLRCHGRSRSGPREPVRSVVQDCPPSSWPRRAPVSRWQSQSSPRAGGGGSFRWPSCRSLSAPR